MDEKTEAQGSKTTVSRSQQWESVRSGIPSHVCLTHRPHSGHHCFQVGNSKTLFQSSAPSQLFGIFSSVQSLSRVRLFVTPWTAAHQASLSITSSWSLLKFMSIESVMPSNHLILCRPLLLPPSFFPSIGVFSNESVLLIKWPKYWSFSFSISPSNEYSGLISFRMDWLDLLVVQGTLKKLLQHHSSKASVLRCSAFLPYSPTLTSIYDYWKNHSLD